jgi:hypothetical protein
MDILTTLPHDTTVSSAFAELLSDVTNLLSAAQLAKPLDKEEISFWKRQLNALNKAESYWLQGVRPVSSGAAYLLASASRPGALVHRLTRHGGILICSCEAGQKGVLCWHHMLMNVIERAAELEAMGTQEEEISSSGPEQTSEAAAAGNPIPHAAAASAWLDAQITLRTRLDATAQILDAMRQAQGRSALSFDPPVDIPDEPPPQTPGGEPAPEWRTRQLGWRLASARKKSAYFASAFYLEAA